MTMGAIRVENRSFFKPAVEWGGGRAKNVTFIVTQECQLRCKYCYLHGKNDQHRMPYRIAQRTIDYLLDAEDTIHESEVILDFIGGEPFLEIDLIDAVCDYFKKQSYLKSHRWFEKYRFNFSTNGIDYHTKKVQRLIDKNREHINVGITIDGTKDIHDLYRVYPDGSGSYGDVVKNISLWLQQFPDGATKVTVSHDTLANIHDSVLHLWNLGIKGININVVFENVWRDGDDEIFEMQLMRLADAIIDNKLYEDGRSCSFFSRSIGTRVLENQNWCGAGNMLAVDSDGNFYPCVRFAPFSLRNKKPRIIGNCFNGIDWNKVRPFKALTMTSQSCKECIDCEIAAGCAWCQGANYDFADRDTIYQRATFLCLMHKARVRANSYFWEKIDAKTGRLRGKV
jgi:uncharacterized protein